MCKNPGLNVSHPYQPTHLLAHEHSWLTPLKTETDKKVLFCYRKQSGKASLCVEGNLFLTDL